MVGEGKRERRRVPGGWVLGAATAPVREWLGEQRSAGQPASIILIGLRRLDLLNAAHGRGVGDAVVKVAHGRLADLAGTVGVTRLGSGRFAIASAMAEDEALALAGEIAEILAQPLAPGVLVGARIGLAVHAADEEPSAALVRAGEALAEAQEGAPLLARRSEASSLDALAIDLHHAIARGEIDILFQPQVDIAEARIVGVEALARWRHPRRGPLGAEALFAAARRADLGLPLSEHIQTLALGQATKWPHALTHLRLSINITAGDVMRPGFASALLARIDASGFAPTRLTLELTETGPLANPAMAAKALGTLRAAECRIAIDDFGAGYSSLAYIKALPLDYLKLDKALIEGVHAGSRDAALLAATAAMGSAMALTVIAEGVETDEQLRMLADAGCAQYQGYLCAPPVDTAHLLGLVGRA
ncbi:GGDEF domain-containing phosphodiesterase [Sphingomonas sp.]|jgi:EAL domain-containing protein (putative c-di-GMP-specific phosphodiesterase class I)/GGDEF domain-containing protein|uniref:GGDEF domain-containing phosphodiesterase n=1 Tax=Sphingomonas sp. TaxID=28214 RepID=UPI002D7ECE78|nr:GGDEF domain-containing phosphodiesterase [Sphingomonas sp.]HEU0044854.1 GGDEF domain-containing phosphodiesterase [Sphingomonas sp.]